VRHRGFQRHACIAADFSKMARQIRAHRHPGTLDELGGQSIYSLFGLDLTTPYILFEFVRIS
jgi:hypothetical protein